MQLYISLTDGTNEPVSLEECQTITGCTADQISALGTSTPEGDLGMEVINDHLILLSKRA